VSEVAGGGIDILGGGGVGVFDVVDFAEVESGAELVVLIFRAVSRRGE
jgi:hypothetical protein